MPSINSFLKGFSNGLPGMKDYRHAARLFVDDNFKLAPKQKFLFHVVFDIDNEVAIQNQMLLNNQQFELNMLVKACDLPRYDMNLEERIQYNKKIYPATRVTYSPINITFHDDMADTVNAFWKKYYEYNIADPVEIVYKQQATKDDYYDTHRVVNRWGKDTPVKKGKPLLRGIEIFVLHKQRFTSFSLVNPVIGSFAHDSLDAADGAGVMSNVMQVFYETVFYSAGNIKKGNQPKGFATIHYDHEPSPLSVLGRGTTSIFGPGGIVDGIGSVIGDVRTGNVNLGTIIKGINTYNNAKKIKAKDAVKEELKGIAKEGVLQMGKQAGSITNPVGNFAVGSQAVAAVVAGATVYATTKGLVDNKKRADNKVINNAKIDTATFLTADESYLLITGNDTMKDKIAGHVYYKDIGSRKGLTVAESDVEYAASSDTIKTVYRNKAVTNIRKLVTEGYIKIERATGNVSISNEKANL